MDLMVKVAAGAMNTHSRVADGRREALCTHAALCGGDRALVRALFDTATTDEALPLLDAAGLREAVMAYLAVDLDRALKRRAGELAVEAVFFSNKYGILGKTPGAEGLMALHRAE